MARMLELFLVCVVLATTHSAPWAENNHLKEYDLEWQCDQLCSRLSGRPFYNEDNSTCSCLVDEEDSDMNWNRVKHNARILGLMLDIINTNSKKILKRETPAERIRSLLAQRFKKPDGSDSNLGQSAPEEKPVVAPVEPEHPEQHKIPLETKPVEPKTEIHATEPVKTFPKLSLPPKLKKLFLEKNPVVAQANPVIEEPKHSASEAEHKKEEIIVHPKEELPATHAEEAKKVPSIKEKLAQLKQKMELHHNEHKEHKEESSTEKPVDAIPHEPQNLGAVLKDANEKHATPQERREAVRTYLRHKFELLKAKNHAHNNEAPTVVHHNN